MNKINDLLILIFEKQFNCLIVDDNESFGEMLYDLLSELKIFKPVFVKSILEALTAIENKKRWHLCIYDLGLTDFENDEMFLIRKYGSYIPFIICTGSNSPEKGFFSSKYGAKGIIEKTALCQDIKNSIELILYHILLGITNPFYGNVNLCSDTFTRITEVLFKTAPLTINDWAIYANISARTIRHIWCSNLKIKAQEILLLYRLMSNIFRIVLSQYGSPVRWKTIECKDNELEMLYERLCANKSKILNFVKLKPYFNDICKISSVIKINNKLIKKTI